ncbi:50S ribosomal protein L10, partial [Escherichia coli]|nr:50S ribosomal protein L10 [Escherichia coli]
MSKVLEAKQSAVEEIKTKLSASASTVIVDYRGLNVGEITELRKQLR